MSSALHSSPNLLDLLRVQADRFPDRLILRFLSDQETEDAFTYADLDRKARAIAAYLQARDARGERALVLHAPGPDYVATLLGCLYAGVIAVPAYPPRMNRSLNRLQDIVADAQARFGLTSAAALARLRDRSHDSSLSNLEWIATDACPLDAADQWRARTPHPDEIALLQYTSGSTSAPKGVALTHANFLHNLRSLASLGAHSDDHFVSWLPPYHDMGLVGATLLPLSLGTVATILSPTTFLQRPSRWLSVISRYRGTISGGPNFAFELCCKRISEEQRATLDLQSWRVAYSGAERVRASTLKRFAERFASAGFKSSAFAPCYGLAEATLAVSFTSLQEEPRTVALDETEFSHGKAVDASDASRARELVSCGVPVSGCSVMVVNPETRRIVRDGAIGELWVASAGVASGYWNKPDLSEEVFRARIAGDHSDRTYLRTGDLGFLRDGEVFVAGRRKELIVLRGRNYHPEDIEVAFEHSHPRLRAGCGVAFAVDREAEEALVIVQEVDSVRDLDAASVIASIRGAIAEQLQLQVHDIVLVEPGTVPKTSSGKLQRTLCRTLYEQERLAIVERSAGAHTVRPVAPQKVERVAALMAEVLHLEEVGADEDFFALGGHSLLATQLVSRIREKFEVDVPLRAVFDAPTARGLAATIQDAPILLQKGPRERVDRAAALPLSFSQERMWLLHQLDPQGAAYNVAGAALIEGPLDADRLEAAFNKVVQQHEVLRTQYPSEDGRPAVRVLESATLVFERFGLVAGEAQEQTARTLASDFAARPFDVANDLLVRAMLIRLDAHRHVVCVSMHHLITDAWSMGLFVRDALRFYDHPSTTPQIADSPLTFIDYAHWQRQYLTDDRLAPQLAYWLEQLKGAEAVELPTDRPRSARRSSAGAMEPLPLPEDLLDNLRAFAEAQGTTLFMVMLAAFEVLLNRYTQRTDLVVGVPVANRNWLASESVMGSLVNTLALRARFDANASFSDLLRQVRGVALDAYSHQDLPFERLISTLPVERRAGESPLIRVMFDFQNAPMPERTAGPVTMRPMMISRHASQFDLSLLILDTDFGRIASVEYSADLFERTTIQRLLDHYVNILQHIVLSPQTSIAKIPLLSVAERQRLLEATAGAAVGEPVDLVAQFEAQAQRTPDSDAVLDAEGTLSYRELDAASSDLAAHLQAMGVGPGQRVAVCLERSRHLVTALLAVLKSGAAYVPLDWRHPAERVNMVLQDADIRVVLTRDGIAERFAIPESAAIVDMTASQSAPGFKSSPASSSQAAYVIYTSGSTGRPKGVEVPRGALANFLRSMRHTPGLGVGERLLSVTTVSFDIAGLELFLPLICGASVFVAAENVVADGRRLMALMESYAPTLMQATPATWKMLLDAGWSGHRDMKILCGGEAFPRELAARLLDRCASLWNMYGPTETTIWSTLHRVTGEEAATIPIGRPIDATTIYVLDEHRQPVPQGVAGEIYIGGAGVASGYFRIPALTAEKFLPDPFSSDPHARMYRTGDAGVWRSDLSLEYLGRLDHQIKLRGFRIEPAEIEQAMRVDTRVLDAVVTAIAFGPADDRLVAYFVASPEHLADPSLITEMTECLARRLPLYMIPSAFVGLERFPQTPNGKIDRKALPMPQHSQSATEEFVEPRDEIELGLQRLWQYVLGTARVGVRHNFFMLGGHSLLAARLFAAIEREFQVPLQLSLLFERPTIEYLAEKIREQRETTLEQHQVVAREFTHLVPIQERGARPRLFCVHGAGGHVLNFWAIAQHLGIDQPFFALQAPGVDGWSNPYDNIESMAQAYLEELRSVQPHGPYYLSGYCGGGWVAFEMASRLRAQGEEVALLALLDAYGPNLQPLRFSRRARRWCEGLLRGGPLYLLRKMTTRLERDLTYLRDSIRIRHYQRQALPIPHDLRDVWLTRSFLAAAARYRPAAYDGKVTLLLARDAEIPEGARECAFGWAELAHGGVDVHQVPGTHFTLTQNPNAAALASTLAKCLANAERWAHSAQL